MTSELLTGSPTFQLDAYLYSIKKEFDRLNQELDEARKQRDEYKTNYKNQENERRELTKLLFHRLNGKDHICQRCKREVTPTAELADDNSPASPSSEHHSPLEVFPDRLDNTRRIIQVEEERNNDDEGTISVENDDLTISGIASPSIASNITSIGWDIKYEEDAEMALKLDLVHELTTQEGGIFSRDGKYLATVSDGAVVCIFDVNTGERISAMRDLYEKPERVSYTCLDFSPDNKYLATGGKNGKARIWIISQRRIRNIFTSSRSLICDLHFSPNGQHLITSSFDTTVRIWKLRNGSSRVLTGGQSHTPVAVRFSPDGRYVASGYNPPQILIWNLRTRRLVARWGGHGSIVSGLVFTPDAKGLLSAAWDKTVVCWDVAWLSSLGITLDNAEDEQDVNSTVTEISHLVGHSDDVCTVSISPDGKWIASGSYDKTVKIWNAHDATLQCTLRGPSPVWTVAFSPVGTYLAIGIKLPQVTVWNYANF